MALDEQCDSWSSVAVSDSSVHTGGRMWSEAAGTTFCFMIMKINSLSRPWRPIFKTFKMFCLSDPFVPITQTALYIKSFVQYINI